MAIRPATPPRPRSPSSPVRAPGGGGNLNRIPARGPSAIRPVSPGTVRPATPKPPPQTPFQPGAGPSPPLNPIAAGLGGLLLLGQALWSLLNQKAPDPPPTRWENVGDTDVPIPSGTNVRVNTTWRITGSATDCNNGNSRNFTVGPGANTASVNGIQRVRLRGLAPQTRSGGCPGGFGISGAFGEVLLQTNNGATFGGVSPIFNGAVGSGSESGSLTLTMRVDIVNTATNQPILPPAGARPDLLPQVRPKVPEPLELPELEPLPLPLPLPLPGVAPAPLPGVSPAPVPSTPGRPGEAPAQVPVRVPTTTPAPGVSPAIRPAQPGPLAVPAVGPAVRPVPPVVPVTPVDVVVVDGEVIGGPGQAPRADMIGIAAELGRIERKTENLMRRPENGGPGELAEEGILGALRDKLQQLLDELLNDVAGGSYQLTRPCPPPGGGEPLPPIVVPYPGGTNPIKALSGKLDGIAGLIQAHKDIGQPTCTTPVTGEEVTVHFESP